MDKSLDRGINVLINLLHKQIIQRFRDNHEGILDNLLTNATSKKFAVIRHGDCWGNNFLFSSDSNVSA